jgi:hypothetical protein
MRTCDQARMATASADCGNIRSSVRMWRCRSFCRFGRSMRAIGRTFFE